MYYISSGFGNGMYTLREHNYIPTNYGFNEKDSYIRNLSRDFDKAMNMLVIVISLRSVISLILRSGAKLRSLIVGKLQSLLLKRSPSVKLKLRLKQKKRLKRKLSTKRCYD